MKTRVDNLRRSLAAPRAVATTLALAAATALATLACGTLRDGGAPTPSHVHDTGFADPQAPAFHGKYLRGGGYDLSTCKSCHGDDLRGAGKAVSCAQCHNGGATACTTCHGQPPTTGAHAAHAPRFACETCHPVPARYDEPGHLRVPGAPRVVLSALALTAGHNGARYQAGRCSDTYCHGAASPAWNGGAAEAACGTCHGKPPPAPHPASPQCTTCHGAVVDARQHIVSPAQHVNGRVDVIDLARGCTSCHGPVPGADGGPPTGLGGAHAAHLAGGRVGRAVACNECHTVPADVAAPGHLDDTPGAEVPLEGVLARTGGLTPRFTAGTCSNTYCHGATLRGGAHTTPRWDEGRAATSCGGCHGVPYPDHRGPICSDCHGAVVDSAFRIIRPDLHMNGRVDLGSAP